MCLCQFQKLKVSVTQPDVNCKSDYFVWCTLLIKTAGAYMSPLEIKGLYNLAEIKLPLNREKQW